MYYLLYRGTSRWRTKTLAESVAHASCRKYVTDMHHEARVQAVIDFYASARSMTITKAQARTMTMTQEQYLEVDE
jgi:DNA primase